MLRAMVRGLVAVVGSANMDLVAMCPRIPQPGETLIGSAFATHPGGKGANQAAVIGRLGGQVAFIGKVGSDSFGEQLRQSLNDARVQTEHLLQADTSSGIALIAVSQAGQNSIVVVPGANDCLTPLEVEHALYDVKPDVVLAQLEVPLEAIQAAAKAERFLLNPAPARALPRELLERVEVLTPNETELEILTGIFPTDDAACHRAASVLLDQGVKAVVVTLGSKGSFLANSQRAKHFDPIAVTPVDTTAAGDAFNGALAWFLAQGRDLENAIALANCVGALSTTKRGAQASMPSFEELRAVASNLL